jgi:hypothetical protein
MDTNQQQIAAFQEKLDNLEKLRDVLGDTITDQKKAEKQSPRILWMPFWNPEVSEGSLVRPGNRSDHLDR